MELQCVAQNYAWGMPGILSRVAQLLKASCSDVFIMEGKGYAELWMGTHPNGASKIKRNGKSLATYLEENPDKLGENITSKFGNKLSFLFKVLSVNKALSIQAHPNKSHAEKLHQEFPDIYKDANHKPEMCLALTSFKALCGFRPAAEILDFLEDVAPLKQLIREEIAAEFISSPSEATLKECFSSLMHCSKEKVTEAINTHISKILSKDKKTKIDDLFITLCKQFPGDRGCFAIYLLNYIVLQPGEAMFLGSNLIHAYLEGDCIECMACSDNVVRAGLTPKFQDVETLVEMLEYEMLPAESRKFEGEVINPYITVFNPPVPDFAVEMIKVGNGDSITLTQYASASILIVIEGYANKLSITLENSSEVPLPEHLFTGTVLFLQPNQCLTLTSDSHFLAFRAFCA